MPSRLHFQWKVELFRRNLDLEIDRSLVDDEYLDEKEHEELKRPGESDREKGRWKVSEGDALELFSLASLSCARKMKYDLI